MSTTRGRYPRTSPALRPSLDVCGCASAHRLMAWRTRSTKGQNLARHRTAGTTRPSRPAEFALGTPAPPASITAPRTPALPPLPPPELLVAPVVRGAHRVPITPPALRGRLIAAALAVGAFVAAGQSLGRGSTQPATSADVALASGATGANLGVGGSTPTPQVLTVAKQTDPAIAAQLAKGQRLGAERAAREAQARRPLYVVPTVGTVTSSFGARWGTQHSGVDIANVIGTPVASVSDGVVLDAGPASGFGLWVRIRHDDGTITVYGHINETLTRVGARVTAGQEIATVGNRGESTGPHLHFEVWEDGSTKVDPQAWLAQHGLRVG